VRRCADLGSFAVTFPENPFPLGLPSIHDKDRYWEPFFAACADTGTVLCMHIGSGTKTMTTGEGGMFVTNDHALYDRVMTLNNHGRVPGGKQFWSDFIGFKYRISNIQAAIGCAQLERVDALVARKREIFAAYVQHLGGINGIALNPEAPGTLNSYWMPTVVFDEALGITRDGLLAAFSRRGIDARVFFYPLSQMELFGTSAASSRNNAPNSYAIAERAINLPSYHDMSSADIDTVSQVVIDLVQEHQEKLTCLAS